MNSERSDKPDFVNLKSIFGEKNSNQKRSFSKPQKRRAPLPPTVIGVRKTSDTSENSKENIHHDYYPTTAPPACQNIEEKYSNYQIIEKFGGRRNSKISNGSVNHEKDFDINSELKELEVIANCYNDLKVKLEKNTSPCNDGSHKYDVKKNPFHEDGYEDEEEFDEKNPFRAKALIDEIIQKDTKEKISRISDDSIDGVREKTASNLTVRSNIEEDSIEIRRKLTPSRIPKRTISVNSGEASKEPVKFQRNGDVRHSVGHGTKSQKEGRLSRTNSEDNRDPLETLKKPWTRVSAKFKREPLNVANKGPGRGNNRPSTRKQNNKTQVGKMKIYVVSLK